MKIAIAEIDRAWATWITSVGSGNDRERKAKRYLRELIGNAVFAARRPSNAHEYRSSRGGSCSLAMTIERQNVDREYVLDGESDYAESSLVATIYARGERASVWAKRAAEAIRQACSGFQGEFRYRDDDGDEMVLEIDACQLVGDGDLPPVESVKTGERWEFRYRQRWAVMHSQTPTRVRSQFESVPPPQGVGIGADVIGDTAIL